jgi:hypothetical protein
MPWVAPVVAHVDHKGCMFCVSCDPELQTFPVYSDAHFTADDSCDRCGKQLEHVPTSKYIKV